MKTMMKNKIHILYLSALFLSMNSITIAADSEKSAAAVTPPPAAPAAEQKKEVSTPIAVTEEALREFESRKKSLDAREQQLDERARALDLQEKILKEKLHKMEEL